MLNKLLKRCMPWQQRGRWVRVYYDALEVSDVQDISFKCPDFMTVSAESELEVNIRFTRPVAQISTYITITHIKRGNIPNTNIIYGDFTPGQMIGSKGYVDLYISDVEVIDSDGEVID